MYFRKSLRALTGHTYDPADFIAPTDEEAFELGYLDTSKQQGSSVEPLFHEVAWPDSFVLRVHLAPVSLATEAQQVNAQYTSNDVAYQKVPFYDAGFLQGSLANNCYAAVELIYEGTGFYIPERERQIFKGFQFGEFAWNSLQKEKPALIYRKPFPMQTVPELICTHRHQGAGKWMIETHQVKERQVNEMPIFAYGGYYQLQQPLEKCVPIYATLSSSAEQKTLVLLKSQQYWHEKRVFEAQPGRLGETTYYFHDSMNPEEILSLSAAIASGCAQVCLEQDDEKKLYKSFRYEHTSIGRDTIDITFIQHN